MSASDSAGDVIWGVVCGLPEPAVSDRPLLMLKAYFDDSGMRQPPAYVLAGWMAPPKIWAPFSNAWDEVLRMSPRVRYFKLVEAMNLLGEFNGMSEEKKREKLTLLVGVIDQFKPTAVVSVLPHFIFDQYFSLLPKSVRNPYVPSVLGIVGLISQHFEETGCREKVEYIFDYQPASDQMNDIQSGWEMFRSASFPHQQELMSIPPPQFLDDKEVIPLQAADLLAGWKRLTYSAAISNTVEPLAPWDRLISVPILTRVWDHRSTQQVMNRGIWPYLRLNGAQPF